MIGIIAPQHAQCRAVEVGKLILTKQRLFELCASLAGLLYASSTVQD